MCAWEPATKKARGVLGDMYFANGIAVDPGQEFVLVTESSRYRVRRVWIAGERTGEHEVIIDNLPGIPDGTSTGSNGIFWMGERIWMVASVQERAGHLYLGSAADHAWARIPVP